MHTHLKLKQLTAICLLISISLLGCKKDDNNNNNNNNDNNNNNNIQFNQALKFLTIADASTLFIGTTGSAKSKGMNDSRLYKITYNGLVIEVKYLDDKGDTLIHVNMPTNICNLSPDYFTVTFNFGEVFLVRKSDGAVFKGDKLPMMLTGYNSQRKDLILQFDQAGNIYYKYSQMGGYIVAKLNISDPNNPTVVTYSASGDQIIDFCIDKFGNMMYDAQDPTMQNVKRYRHATEGFTNFTNYHQFFTNANEDTIFSLRNYSQPNERDVIGKVIPSPFSIVSTKDSTHHISMIFKVIKMKAKNKVIIYGMDANVSGAFFWEFTNSTTVYQHSISDFNLTFTNNGEVKDLIASENYYYILATNTNQKQVILRVDPTDHSFTETLMPAGYDVHSMIISPDDQIQFQGLRLSDGNRVVAALSNGQVTILKVLGDMTVSTLERMN